MGCVSAWRQRATPVQECKNKYVSVFTKLPTKARQEIERQVERLGFEADYAVSRTWGAGAHLEQGVNRVSPAYGGAEG